MNSPDWIIGCGLWCIASYCAMGCSSIFFFLDKKPPTKKQAILFFLLCITAPISYPIVVLYSTYKIYQELPNK